MEMEKEEEQELQEIEEEYVTIKSIVEDSEVQWIVKVPNDAYKLDKIRLTIVDDIPKIRSTDPLLNNYMEKYGISWLKLAAYKYNCLLCGITKRTTLQIFRHLMQNHIKERLYGCSLCEKKFFTNKSLNSHIRNVHYKTKRLFYTYKCPKCNKGYVSLQYFVKHLEAEARKEEFLEFTNSF